MTYSSFSSPHEGDFVHLSSLLSNSHFNNVENRINSLRATHGYSQLKICREGMNSSGFLTRAWIPELGAARIGLVFGLISREEIQWMSAQFQIAAFLAGLCPAIEMDITSPHPLVAGGRIVQAGDLSIRTSRNELLIENRSTQKPLNLERVNHEGISPLWVENKQQDIVSMGDGALAIISTGEWMTYWKCVSKEHFQISHEIEKFRCQVERSVQFLEKFSPLYYLWVVLLLKEIVGIEKSDTRNRGTCSQSFLLWPGQIQISVGATLVQTITMLVHECSHLYFHMAMWGKMVVKKDAPEAYSALKNVNRPLDRVLLGFHAFGNVQLALQSLIENGAPIDFAQVEQERNAAQALTISLDNSLQTIGLDYLEEAGREIYFPLRARLIQTGAIDHTTGQGNELRR